MQITNPHILSTIYSICFRTYTKYEDVVEDFLGKKLHPDDLKPALAKAINDIIRPVREHFERDPVAKKLLKQVKDYKVTK